MSELLKSVDARTKLAGTNKLEILMFTLGVDSESGRREVFGVNVFKVREVMRTNDKVIDPNLDWNEQSPFLKLVVDQDRVRALGLTPQDISQSLSMLISGTAVTTVRDGIEKVEVVARAVPVLVTVRCEVDVSRSELDDVFTACLDKPSPFGDVERLAAVVEVPCGPRTRREVHGTDVEL